MVLTCRKFTFILLLCPAHHPPSWPRGFSKQAQNSCLCVHPALRWLGILTHASRRGSSQRQPAFPLVWWSLALLSRSSFSFSLGWPGGRAGWGSG